MRRVTLFVNGTSKNGKVSENTTQSTLARPTPVSVLGQRCPGEGMEHFYALISLYSPNIQQRLDNMSIYASEGRIVGFVRFKARLMRWGGATLLFNVSCMEDLVRLYDILSLLI